MNRTAKNILAWLGLWMGLFGLVLLIYSKALNKTLIYDDVAMLLYFPPYRDFHWYHIFHSMDNGFYRPIYMLIYWITSQMAGLNPVIYRFHSVAIHTTVAVVAGLVFRRIFKTQFPSAAIISTSIALASSAFASVYYFANTGDSYLALGVLIAIYCCDRWLAENSWRWLAGMFAAVIFAVGIKETGVMVSGILLLQIWLSRRRDWRAWGAGAVTVIFCGAFATLAYYRQKNNIHSYESQGYAASGVFSIADRILSYLAATLFPGSYVMKPYWNWGDNITGVLKVLLRGGMAALVVCAGLIVLLRRGQPRFRTAALLLLGAAGMLLPISLLAFEAGPHSPIGRYLYTSMVLLIMATGGVSLWLHNNKIWLWRGGAIVWICWLAMQVVIIRKSPGVKEYYEASRQWHALTQEMGRLSPSWPPMHAITVYSGQAYGSLYIDSSYATALMRVYYPKLLCAIVSNKVIPETARIYIFDGRHLREANSQ